jgi:hypothetical protein
MQGAVQEEEIPVRYEVQRFSPTECPACGLAFQEEGIDFAIAGGVDIIQAGRDVVACMRCGMGEIERVLEMSVSAPTRDIAKAYLKKGYANLKEIRELSSNDVVKLQYRGLYELPSVHIISS